MPALLKAILLMVPICILIPNRGWLKVLAHRCFVIDSRRWLRYQIGLLKFLVLRTKLELLIHVSSIWRGSEADFLLFYLGIWLKITHTHKNLPANHAIYYSCMYVFTSFHGHGVSVYIIECESHCWDEGAAAIRLHQEWRIEISTAH